MFKILNELAGISTPLPIEDKSDEKNTQPAIDIYRIDDTDDQPEDDQPVGDCGCEDENDCGCDDTPDPVEDIVNRFRDWLTQNMDIEHSADKDGDYGSDLDDGSDLDAVENEEPTMGQSPDMEQSDTDQPDIPMGDESDLGDADGELGTGPDELEEPNRQGMIRTVKGAHLVYKRKNPDGFYDELWFFNIGKDTQRDEMEVRKAILAGTDIPEHGTKSDDGNQSYDLWTSGNGQLLKISGLPN